MRIEYDVRLAEINDLEKLSAFRKEYFSSEAGGRSSDAAYYQWKITDNPFLPGEIWLAEYQGNIIGSASITPKPMIYKGETIIGAETGDTFTHPEFQRQGIFATLLNQAINRGYERGIRFIYGFPNSQSMPAALKRTPYKVANIGLRNTLKVLDSAAFLPKRPALLISSRSILNPFLKMTDPSRRISKKLRANIRISTIETLPDDFDHLWESVSGYYDIAVVKNRRYVTWRYISNPDAYLVLLARDETNSVAGYLVATTRYPGGTPVFVIVDYLTVRDDGSTFYSLVTSLVSIARAAHANAVSAVTVQESYFHLLLKKLGFINRNEVTLISTDTSVTGDAARNYRWHFTFADSDNI